MNTSHFWVWTVLLVTTLTLGIDLAFALEWGAPATLSDHVRAWYGHWPGLKWLYIGATVFLFWHFFIEKNPG